jgi:hypothetical protein
MASIQACLAYDARSNTPSISVEILLTSILESQRDFAVMMRELMETLRLADACTAEDILEIEFDFDDVSSSAIKLTLEAFQAKVNQVQKLLLSRPQLANQDQLWALARSLHEISRTAWPAPNPILPYARPLTSSGYPALDDVLGQCLQVVREVRDWGRQFGPSRRDAYEAIHASSQPLIDRGSSDWAVALTDYWDLVVESSSHAIASATQDGRLDATDVTRRIVELLDTFPRVEGWVEQTVNQLLDLLNLPMWKRRHEMYSVWVGSVLLRTIAARNTGVVFHPEAGVLSFSFAGKHLATYTWKQRTFHVWCELRSPLEGKSAKRKKGIQPDFRVRDVTKNSDATSDTRLVLECKHYLVAGKSNFVGAAVDYAHSCPNAHVMVVNHGFLDENKLVEAVADIDKAICDRISFLGSATSTDERMTRKIASGIESALFPGPAALAQISAPNRPGSDPLAIIQLSWSHPLQDIDLSLEALNADGEQVAHVYFHDKGSDTTSPFSTLDNDVQSGSPGARSRESLEIHQWHYPRYELFAKNYTGTPEMSSNLMECVITISGNRLPTIVPVGDCGIVWHIATILVRNGTLLVNPSTSSSV